MGGETVEEGMAVGTIQQTGVADHQHAAVPDIPGEASCPLA